MTGHVLRQWEDQHNGSSVEYEFTDFTGQSHKAIALDYTKKLFPEMPVAVFYDRNDPKRQIASCATLHEVVVP